jgi:large subunit ribosomal protein L6
MSRIGKLPIELPENVKLTSRNGTVTVEGPKGTLESRINYGGNIRVEDGVVTVEPMGEDNESRAHYGLTRSLLYNMVVGVSSGFARSLKVVGVGYKCQLQGNTLLLNVGYSHQISYEVPGGITIELPDPNTIVIRGIDKRLVGQVAAEIRMNRPPEPYKGKGIMYADEIVRRKAGKAGVK